MINSVIPGELYSSEESKKFTGNSFLPKKTNKEKFITEEMLDNMTLYELKIIMLFEITVSRTLKDVVKSQQIELSHNKLIKKYPNKDSFLAARNALEEKGIIKRVPGRAAIYQFHFDFIGNGTDESAVQAGLKEDTAFLKKNRINKQRDLLFKSRHHK